MSLFESPEKRLYKYAKFWYNYMGAKKFGHNKNFSVSKGIGYDTYDIETNDHIFINISGSDEDYRVRLTSLDVVDSHEEILDAIKSLVDNVDGAKSTLKEFNKSFKVIMRG